MARNHISFPPSRNPVLEGIKKHRTAQDYFLTLKEKAADSGMTAIEWNWYRARQKEWEPGVYAAEMQAAERRMSMDFARRLSLDDLKIVLAEKLADERDIGMPPR